MLKIKMKAVLKWKPLLWLKVLEADSLSIPPAALRASEAVLETSSSK